MLALIVSDVAAGAGPLGETAALDGPALPWLLLREKATVCCSDRPGSTSVIGLSRMFSIMWSMTCCPRIVHWLVRFRGLSRHGSVSLSSS